MLDSTPTVSLIAVHLGEHPGTMDFFLRSAGMNPAFEFIVLSDDTAAAYRPWPVNVRHVPVTRAELESRCASVLGYPVPLGDPRKLCDLRPVFGLLFADLLEGREFWGFIDLDVIWGSLDGYLGEEVRAAHDVISADPRRLCGPCTLVRNDRLGREMGLGIPDLEDLLRSPAHRALDERHFDARVRALAEAGERRCLYSHAPGGPPMQDYGADSLDAPPPRFPCTWRHGRLTVHAHGRETMLVHLLRVADRLACDPHDARRADTWIITRGAILPWPMRRPAGGAD